MKNRKRLLFLCQNLPYPPNGGNLIRSYHTLRLLCQQFEVHALFFSRASMRRGGEDQEEGLAHLRSLASTADAFPIPQDQSLSRFGLDHLRSLLTRSVYTRWVYESRAFRSELNRLLERYVFDIVHVDSLDLVAYLPDLPRPLVVAHHNVESQLLARRAKAEKPPKGAYVRWQGDLMRKAEKSWCPEVDLNICVSPEDLSELQEIAPGGDYLVIPNGVDTTSFSPRGAEPKRGGIFVGGATWFPNLDGMEYFANEILPLIRDQLPNEKFVWIGRIKEELRVKFEALGVDVLGYVDDIREEMDRAACSIVPLRVGGGTRLKILDAWAMGKAVVSTPQGCEGLGAVDGRDMLIADTPAEFAKAVVRVLTDTDLRDRLGKNGRERAVTEYDWSVIGQRMHEAYEKLAASEAGEWTPRS